jgi:hypothetical protein
MDVRRNAGMAVEVVIGGDFNRHDQLWGGDDVSLVRQGEADRIIDLMSEFALSSWNENMARGRLRDDNRLGSGFRGIHSINGQMRDTQAGTLIRPSDD